MGEVKPKTTKSTKKEAPTVEELNNWCQQLAEQNRQLRQQVAQMNLTNVFKRQDYLFQVLNHVDLFPVEAINQAVKDTVEFLFPIEEYTDEQSNQQNGESE